MGKKLIQASWQLLLLCLLIVAATTVSFATPTLAETTLLPATSQNCEVTLLNETQILERINEELQSAKLYAPRATDRIVLKMFAARITREVLRICGDIGGCTAADITEITENQIATRLKAAAKTEHSIRVWAGYSIIIGAMISSAAAGGVLKDSLNESYKWVADYLVTPAVWLGILKLGEPLWRSLNGSFATVGYKLTTGDTQPTQLRTAETRHFDTIYDNMRNDFTEEQNKAALLLHSALSRVEGAAGEAYELVLQNNHVQAGARIVYTLTVLRTIFPFIPLDEPLLVEAFRTRLTRRITDRVVREQIYAATLANLPNDLEQRELIQLKQYLKNWLMLGANQL